MLLSLPMAKTMKVHQSITNRPTPFPFGTPYNQLLYLLLPIAILSVYVFSFKYNGFQDLPNHMARAYILLQCLGEDSTQSVLCEAYKVQWSALPYFFADAVLMLCLSLFPVFVAEKVSVFILGAIFTFGWFVLYRTVVGRMNIGYLAGLLLILNNFLFNGFYAYVLSIALSMFWLAYWWPRRNNKNLLTQSVLILGMLIIFGVHLAGLVFVTAFYAFYELYRVITAKSGQRTRAYVNAIGGLPILVTFVGLHLIQQVLVGGTALENIHYNSVLIKLLSAPYPFINHSKLIDPIFLGATLLLLLTSLKYSQLRVFARSYWAWATIGFFIIYLIVPSRAHGVALVDVRFLMPAFMAFFVGVGLYVDNCRKKHLAMVLVITVSTGFNFVNKVYLNREISIADEMLSSVPPGARLIQLNSVEGLPNENLSRVRPFIHFSSYHLMKSNGDLDYVYDLFDCHTNKNIQYICLHSDRYDEFQSRKYYNGLPNLGHEDLSRIADAFDYVLVIELRGVEFVKKMMMSERFQLVRRKKYFYVYRTLQTQI